MPLRDSLDIGTQDGFAGATIDDDRLPDLSSVEAALIDQPEPTEEELLDADLAAPIGLLSLEEEGRLTRACVERRNAWRAAVLSDIFGRRAALVQYRLAARMEQSGIAKRMFSLHEKSPLKMQSRLLELIVPIDALAEQDVRAAHSAPAQDDLMTLFQEYPLSIRLLRKIAADRETMLAAFAVSTPEQAETLACEHLASQEECSATAIRVSHCHRLWKEVRDRIVLANRPLAASIAKRNRQRDMEFRDVLSLGTIGLLIAVDKYDPSRRIKFGTYATWWIRQSVLRGIEWESRVIRLPSGHAGLLYAITQFRHAYFGDHGRTPTVADIATQFHIDEDLAEHFLRIRKPVSLNTTGDRVDRELGESIPDREAPDTVDEAQRNDVRERVIAWVMALPPVEREIINARFGLGLVIQPVADGQSASQAIRDEESYGMCRTLEDIGREWGMSRERVRQRAAAGLRHLRELSTKPQSAVAPPRPQYADAHMNLRIAELELPAKIVNALRNHGVYYVGDYVRMIADGAAAIPGIGGKSQALIEHLLRGMGIWTNTVVR